MYENDRHMFYNAYCKSLTHENSAFYVSLPSIFPYQQTVPSGKLWTQEEDAIVLRHCSAEKNFSNWSGLATKHLPDRTGKQIRDVSSIAFRGLSVEGIHGRFRLHHSHLMIIYSPLSLLSSFSIEME